MPECGFCKDCRHWKADYDNLSGTCQRVETPYTYDEWHSGCTMELKYYDHMGDGAFIETDPLFGCLQFQPKEP